MNRLWTRRAWVRHTAHHSTLLVGLSAWRLSPRPMVVAPPPLARHPGSTFPPDPAPLLAVAQQGVEAAQAAGARYADVRLTRTVGHRYAFGKQLAHFEAETEVIGVGVRALVQGYWGFAAGIWRTPEAVVQLAREAVALATVSAKGPPRTVDLGAIPVATGTWATPLQRDPFAVTVEEKLDYLHTLMEIGAAYHLIFPFPPWNFLEFHRQERIVATSEGSRFVQTIYESGGEAFVQQPPSSIQDLFGRGPKLSLRGLTAVGKGWEFLEEAQLPDQLAGAAAALAAQQAGGSKGATIGRYTVVCDGATMAALVDGTLGQATQLDRALGYEANATGTSFLNDPLAMVGQYRVASPLVTVTANRSAPTQLATVQWDEEGVMPAPFPLIKDGIVVDFQTTREQAAWLAPYYQRIGQPVRSHGCAGAEDALGITLQTTPNLTLAPSPEPVHLDDMVAAVPNGLLITNGGVGAMDFQARSGLLFGATRDGLGEMREIRNGRLGRRVEGGQILFDAVDLWRHVTAVGGAATEGGVVAPRGERMFGNSGFMYGARGYGDPAKGEPAQTTSYSVRAVAATIQNQPLIDARRKA